MNLVAETRIAVKNSPLAIIFCPAHLARFIVKSNKVVLILMGVLLSSIETSMAFSSPTASASEPFENIGACIEHLIIVVSVISLFLLFFFGLSAALFMLVMGARLSPTTWDRLMNRIAAALLSSLSTFLPMTIWSLVAAFASLAPSSVQIYGPDGKPSWIPNSAVQARASEYWLLVFLALAIWFAKRTIEPLAILEDTRKPRCAHCGYLLIALPTNRCPECGRLFSTVVLLRNSAIARRSE